MAINYEQILSSASRNSRIIPFLRKIINVLWLRRAFSLLAVFPIFHPHVLLFTLFSIKS